MMRKVIILSIILILFSSNGMGYDVFPDSNGNRLNIRIENTSSGFSIPQVKVNKQSIPSWVVGFSPSEVNLGNIGTNQYATATFTFNIASSAQIGNSGNISLLISAGSGDTWSKDVRLEVINPNGAISGDVDVGGLLETPNGAILTYTGPVSGMITLGITGWYTINDLPPGTYTVMVSKTGYTPVPSLRQVRVNHGQTTSKVDFTLIKPPQPPTLHSPADGSTVTTPRPKLNWNTVEGGGNKRYRLQVDNDSNFSSPVFDVSNITSIDYTPRFDLSNNTTYYWRVMISNEAGDSNWSSVWNFKVSILPYVPNLSFPSNGSTISSLQPNFDWDDTNYTTSYQIQVDDNSNFSSPEINKSGITVSSYNHNSNLAVDTKYYWQVRGKNSVGEGNWSSRWWFKTPSPPSSPSLSSPSNGAIISDNNSLTLSWSSVSNVSFYQIQVSKSSDFSSTVIDIISYSTSYTAYYLDNNTIYYWRVRASNSIGNSAWSSSRWFKIAMPTKGDFWFVGDLWQVGGNSGVSVELKKGSTVVNSGQTNYWGDFNKETNYEFEPGNYTVKGWKSGYKVKRIQVWIGEDKVTDINVDVGVGEQNIEIKVGKTTKVKFDFKSSSASAQISLFSTSSPSTIRNAQIYYSSVKAMAIDDTETIAFPTSVSPILRSGEVNVLVNTSMSLSEPPSLNYTVGNEKPNRVELRGSGRNFQGEIYIESITPEGTYSFHYHGVDENGSVSTEIEYGEEFVVDTTIYPDEGGYVSNRDGAGASVLPGALPIPVNITITSPQSLGGPQRSLANSLNAPLEINEIPYLPLIDTMRQFRMQIDSKESTWRLNDEIKGVTISIPYPDQNQDGIVDGANLDEESLKIVGLKNGRWEVVEKSKVDKERNIVSADVNAFTTFMLIGAKVITDVDNIIASPNPWYVEKGDCVKITFIPLNSQPKVYIYNIAGELVRRLSDGKEIISSGQGYMEASWDGKNDSGVSVSYGVYIYVVECNKGTKKGKIGVIR